MAADEATNPSLTSSQVAPEQYVLAGGTTLLTTEAAAIWEQALAKARGHLANVLSDPNREALFAAVFGQAGTDAATFAANLQNLIANLGGDGLQIPVDLRSDGELAGGFAAYTASGHTGTERIYVNADTLNNGLLDVNLATSALLEEFGHALDWRLNGGVDSPGDEGQLFAAEVSGVVLTTEQRAVIDVEDDTTVQYVVVNDCLPVLSAEAASLWDQALTQASAYLAELLTRADRDTLLNEVFGRAGTEATVFEANKQALLEAIGTTGLRIATDLRSGTEMEGAIGAYAQVGPNGNEQIYINADWINAGNLSLEQLTAVLLEEYGHALDVHLNPGLESAGDEGELFANLITNAGLNADQIAAINTQNDWGTVQVDGQTVVVEQADVTITWTGTTSNVLNVEANYTGGSVLADGNPSALFIFGDNAASRYSLTNSAEFKANSFEFTGTNSYDIANSGRFNFIGTGTGITQSSSANQTISGGIKISDGPFTLGGIGTGLVTLSGTSNDYASKGLSKTGSSAFLLSSGNTLTTDTVTISGGTLALSSGTSLAGQIQLRGGVIATSGTFARGLGTGSTSVNFGAGGGGFAAYGGALTVSTALGTWASTTNGLAVSTPLILGSRIADNVVILSNTLNLRAD
jgi:hypothetical protein